MEVTQKFEEKKVQRGKAANVNTVLAFALKQIRKATADVCQ